MKKKYEKTKMPDGLYRNPDGSRVFTDDLTPVAGVNAYGQVDRTEQEEQEIDDADIKQAEIDSAKF